MGWRVRALVIALVFVSVAGCGGEDDERNRVTDQYARQSRAALTGSGIQPTTDRCARMWGAIPSTSHLSEARFLRTCVNG
ncbi:hypothetical protein [Embleya sp. NPDC050493]|uniref:hypothetical protein n=1 Tax=Embleya sp. NPDC050493 TaxID=3363989 RepID=UPI0037AA2738